MSRTVVADRAAARDDPFFVFVGGRLIILIVLSKGVPALAKSIGLIVVGEPFIPHWCFP